MCGSVPDVMASDYCCNGDRSIFVIERHPPRPLLSLRPHLGILCGRETSSACLCEQAKGMCGTEAISDLGIVAPVSDKAQLFEGLLQALEQCGGQAPAAHGVEHRILQAGRVTCLPRTVRLAPEYTSHGPLSFGPHQGHHCRVLLCRRTTHLPFCEWVLEVPLTVTMISGPLPALPDCSLTRQVAQMTSTLGDDHTPASGPRRPAPALHCQSSSPPLAQRRPADLPGRVWRGFDCSWPLQYELSAKFVIFTVRFLCSI